VPTLVAASLVTERIRLGTLVASPNFRHPVTFAKELMTLDDVSEGRLTVGIGAGGEGWDATMLGQDAWSRRERADRFTEFVELLDRLLREPAVSHRGRFYSADEARAYPGCVQRPRVPFAIAATGPRGMDLAARYAETWVTTGTRASEHLDGASGAALVARQIEHLTEACRRVGRDPNALDRLVVTGAGLDPGLSSVQEFRDTAARYADAGVTDLVVHWPRSSEPYAADPEIFESIL
jgi:alkanesulfonate monooxygenase SsuD/methylene tetrahydromethanopterin reductase-like flavin-dependent oxidoreductase (luciferase family)